MKSIKNHFSLVVALFSILFSIQIFILIDRSVDAYKENLAKNYSVIVVSQKSLEENRFFAINNLISEVKELSPDAVIKRLNTNMSSKNIQLLKITLPKFYKLKLKYFPSPIETKKLKKDLLRNRYITKVENFSANHDVTYKLLLLFKSVIFVFAVMVFIVTVLLIFKELRIWQFKHNERMNIMGLFGAASWLRSAVLFRMAIVDAIISSALIFATFIYISSSKFIMDYFKSVDINIVVFNPVDDFSILFGIALLLAVLLAFMVVIGHKEEV